ncbi:MAG: hypothetical protein RIR70_1944, partial [Pseudomonadota bacterium]
MIRDTARARCPVSARLMSPGGPKNTHSSISQAGVENHATHP